MENNDPRHLLDSEARFYLNGYSHLKLRITLEQRGVHRHSCASDMN